MSQDFGRFRTPDNQHEFDGIKLPDGSVRLLAATPPDPHKLRAAPTWQGAGMPTIPDSQLTDNPAWWDAPLIDQRSHGSCFPAGTLIRMADGSERPIEKVQLLDHVLTAEGNIGRVRQLMVREEHESIVRVRIRGHNHLRLTGEHPVLTRRGYVPAADLVNGDRVAMPRYLPETTTFIETAPHVTVNRWTIKTGRKGKSNSVGGRAVAEIVKTFVPDVIHLTPGAGRIFGLFLAEGSTDAAKVVWTFNVKEEETLAAELIRLLQDEWGVPARLQRRPNNTVKVVVYGKPWATFFESLCSCKSWGKRLHPDLTSGPRGFLAAMLDGWIDGDGYERRKSCQGVTVSHDLALSMFDIAQALGRQPTIRHSVPGLSPGVQSRRPRWDIEYGAGLGVAGQSEMAERHVWREVKGVDVEPFSGFVYNLSVEGDESYVAEGIGVHNCVGFSVSIAIMHKRARDGYATPKLSGAYLYSKVNGGRDAGAAISDGIEAAKQFGTCLETSAPWDDIYPSRYDRAKCDAEALYYRVDDYWRLESPEDVLSALELGCTVGAAVQVGNDFMRLDADGAWGVDHGPGNHAVTIDGKYRHPKTGKWMFPNPMSWGEQVGMTGPPPAWLKQVEPNVPADLSGWGFFTLDHLHAVGFQEIYAIRSVAFGPDSDPGPPSPIA